MSSSYSFRDYSCNCYQFDFQPKGFQVKFDKDNNTTKQFFPYHQLTGVRLDYLFEDKVHVLTILFKDSIKFAYSFKSGGEADRIYQQILDAINSSA
jgi:hypothetical protein